MATINHIVLPDGTSYEIEDTVARAGGGGGGSLPLNFYTDSKLFTNTSQRVTVATGTTDVTVFTATAPLTGYMVLSGYVAMTSNSSGNRHIAVTVAGDTVYMDTRPAHSTNNGQMGCSGVFPCTAGNTILVRTWQTSGSTLYAGGMVNILYFGSVDDGDTADYGTTT